MRFLHRGPADASAPVQAELVRSGSRWALVVGLALAWWMGSPSQAAPLTLVEVLERGLPASADLERSRRELERSAAAESFSRSQRWPRLDLIGAASGTQVGTSIGVITNLPTFGDLSFGLGQQGYAVLQSLFAGGGVVLNANLLPISEGWQVAAAVSSRGAAGRQLSENERQVRFDLESTYRELQLRQALVPVWETALQASTALERDVSKIHAKGLAARIDVLRARALRANDSQGLIAARAQQMAVQGRLAELLRMPLEEPPLAADAIASLESPWPLSLEATLERALKDRPLLEALQLQERASHQRARAARATLLPSLSLVAGAGINTNRIDVPVLQQTNRIQAGPANVTLPSIDTPGSLNGNFYDWGGLLQLRQPLFDGGRARDGAALAEREAAVVAADADLARRRIRSTVQETWQQLQASPSRIAAAREAVAAAERALGDAQLRYRAQVEPLTEVLLVQRDLQASRATLLTAQTEQAIARAQLVRETGDPPATTPRPMAPQ
ncbi:MAG: TolC family protein [Cyanobacteriota bacterium]|nr:TolC family protein [Cyanobacteriota bacterium]